MARIRSRTGGGRGVLRGTVLALAVGLAVAATAAVVLTEDPQTLRLAVVGALWAFVLGALAAPRRRAGDDGVIDASESGLSKGKELELRRTYEIELEREVAARREYEMQLEVYLRRELERGLAEDVQTLREEIERLRGEVIERLDGELRMERIETTRLIGGSLRALQDEARRLGLGLQVPGELAEPAFSVREPAELPAGYPTDAEAVPAVPAAATYDPLGADRPGPSPGPAPSYSGSYGGSYVPSPGPPYGPPGGSPAYGGYDPPYAAAAEPVSSAYSAYPSYAEPGGYSPADRPTDAVPAAPPPPPPSIPPPPVEDELGPLPGPPAPRAPARGEMDPPRRRRYRDDGEANEVMSRLLGR